MPTSTESSLPALPKNFLRPCLLLLLREQTAHGYQLLDRLRAFGFEGSDPGGLYRALRKLENEGLVHSAWQPSGAGPDRRIYDITRAGMKELHGRAKALAETRQMLASFLGRYEEFVALDPVREQPEADGEQPEADGEQLDAEHPEADGEQPDAEREQAAAKS